MNQSFQTIVMVIAVIILIITLIVIGVSIYTAKNSVAYPPVVANCPDYWLDESDGDSSNCVNVKNLGTCNTPKMDFSTAMWTGNAGMCNKARWAKACNLTWDGITNSSMDCVNIIGK